MKWLLGTLRLLFCEWEHPGKRFPFIDKRALGDVWRTSKCKWISSLDKVDLNWICSFKESKPPYGIEPLTLTELASQSYRVQKPLVFVVSRHRLGVAAEALHPPVQDAVSVWGSLEAGSPTTLQAIGHGVGWAVQQEHCTGFPHLTHTTGAVRN